MSRENHNSKRHMHPNVHCNTMYNGQNVELTLMSINGGMHKEDVEHIYNGILLSHKREQNWLICRDMSGSRDCHTEWSKSEREKQISYLNTYMKVKVKSLSRVRLFATPWTVTYQAPPSMGFSRQECWSALPLPSPGDLPDPGIEPRSPALQANALPSEPPGKLLWHNPVRWASLWSGHSRKILHASHFYFY